MKKLLLALTVITFVSTTASASCNLGVKENISEEAAKVLSDKGYNLVPLEQVKLGDKALKISYGSEKTGISALFCTTQYKDIAIVEKGEFDKLVHGERISSCRNTSAMISNEAKKTITALESMPSCK